MSMEDIHAAIAAVAGQVSLALVRRRVRPPDIRRWATTLRSAASALEHLPQARDTLSSLSTERTTQPRRSEHT